MKIARKIGIFGVVGDVFARRRPEVRGHPQPAMLCHERHRAHRRSRGLIVVLILSLVCPQPLLAQAQKMVAAPEDPEYLKLVAHLRAKIDPARLSPEAMLEKLDYEPEQILEFVRTDIRFEQYPGTLRGALGTLMSRAGNALDQSILLATLLRDAGADARIARGQISELEARRLLERMKAPSAGSGSVLDLDAVLAILKQTDHPDVRAWLDPEEPPATTRELVEDIAATIQKMVPPERSDQQAMQSLLKEAQDYYWVEYRDAAAQPWTGAHPAFAAAGDPSPTVIEYFGDSVPESLQHRFRVRVFLESLHGDELVVRQITPDWERPVANMTGRAFSVLNNPVNLGIKEGDKDFAEQFSERMENTTLFVPVINGNVLPGTQGFDLDGVPYDFEAQGLDTFGVAPLFKTLGSQFDRAAVALSGSGHEQQRQRMRYLTAEWIEYALISPAGEERVFRRYLVDRIGPAVRATRDLASIELERPHPWTLMASENYVLATGALPAELVLREYTNWMSARAQLAKLRTTSGHLTLRDYAKALEQTQGPEGLRLFSLVRHFDANLGGDDNATYRSAPTLVALHWSGVDAHQIRVSTDIMSNERRGRHWDEPKITRAQILRRGVWETYAERFALDSWQASTDRESPFGVFSFPNEERHSLTPLIDSVGPSSARLGLSADAKVRLREDADRQVVIARVDSNPETEAWWRVDPRTGSVIGVLSDGRGAIAAEYKVLLILASISALALAVRGFSRCAALLVAESEKCIGSMMNAITGNAAQPYVDAYASECFWEQAMPWSDDRDPQCRCGGLSQPACPDWHQPFAN